ncbi:MAG: hypothetical protein AAF587_42515 [Bacteroidota bacterium]
MKTIYLLGGSLFLSTAMFGQTLDKEVAATVMGAALIWGGIGMLNLILGIAQMRQAKKERRLLTGILSTICVGVGLALCESHTLPAMISVGIGLFGYISLSHDETTRSSL